MERGGRGNLGGQRGRGCFQFCPFRFLGFESKGLIFLLTFKHGLLILCQGSYYGAGLLQRFSRVNSLPVFVGFNISFVSA